MKTNIGKAISLLNTVEGARPELDKINAAITFLKREDEQRQPLVPQKFSDDAMLNALSKEQLIHIVKCTEACLAKNNGEHTALCAVAEAMQSLINQFELQVPNNPEWFTSYRNAVESLAALAAVRNGN